MSDLRIRPRRRDARVRCCLLAAALLVALPASAGPPSSAEAELNAAFADLDALARRTRQAGELPRWSDPEAGRVLARLWNRSAILGAPPYSATDVPLLLDIGDRQNAVYKAYVLFAPRSGTLPDTAANTIRYQDEIARAMAMILHVQAAQVEAVGAFWSSLPAKERTPVRRAGAQQARVGVIEFLTGVMATARLPALRSDNRRIMMDALAETAGTLAEGLPIPDRTAMAAQVTATAAALPAGERERVISIKAAFVGTNCQALCAIERD